MTLARLLRPGGYQTITAESVPLKHQPEALGRSGPVPSHVVSSADPPDRLGIIETRLGVLHVSSEMQGGVRGNVVLCPVGMNGVRNRVMNATRLFLGAAVIVCLSATARAESPPAWQAPDFVMEEIVVTAPPSVPLYTEEIVVTARVAARPGGEADTAAAPAVEVTPGVIDPPQLFSAGDVIRRQGGAADERSVAALWRYAIRHAMVTGRLLL